MKKVAQFVEAWNIFVLYAVRSIQKNVYNVYRSKVEVDVSRLCAKNEHPALRITQNVPFYSWPNTIQFQQKQHVQCTVYNGRLKVKS